MSTIFSVPGQNQLYERVRNPAAWLQTRTDGTSQERQQKLVEYLALRDRMESAWCTFESSAEKNFLYGLRDTFWAGWFELYLQQLLIDQGLDNKATNGQGEADFIVHYAEDHLFDIEATILTAGSGANSAPRFAMPDSDNPLFQNVSDKVWNVGPDGEIFGGELKQSRNPTAQSDYCLRITGTLDAKLKQIERWKEVRGRDPSTMPIAVAISSGNIDYDTNGMISHSQFERVLYGKGDLMVPVNTSISLPDLPSYARKAAMTNKNEAPIELALFDKLEYRDISAVIWFSDGLLDYGEHPPEFYINPNAHTQFPKDVLKVGVYKTFDSSGISVVVDYRE